VLRPTRILELLISRNVCPSTRWRAVACVHRRHMSRIHCPRICPTAYSQPSEYRHHQTPSAGHYTPQAFLSVASCWCTGRSPPSGSAVTAYTRGRTHPEGSMVTCVPEWDPLVYIPKPTARPSPYCPGTKAAQVALTRGSWLVQHTQCYCMVDVQRCDKDLLKIDLRFNKNRGLRHGTHTRRGVHIGLRDAGHPSWARRRPPIGRSCSPSRRMLPLHTAV
jgi:hypothetical protein